MRGEGQQLRLALRRVVGARPLSEHDRLRPAVGDVGHGILQGHDLREPARLFDRVVEGGIAASSGRRRVPARAWCRPPRWRRRARWPDRGRGATLRPAAAACPGCTGGAVRVPPTRVCEPRVRRRCRQPPRSAASTSALARELVEILTCTVNTPSPADGECSGVFAA